jgi:ABC-type lipoprotein release transport system permease subunit
MPRLKYKPLTRAQHRALVNRMQTYLNDYELCLKDLNKANAVIMKLTIENQKPQTNNFLWKLRYDNLLLEIKKLNNRIQETVEQDK